MIIKVKTLVFCENFMNTETFTYLFFNSSLFSLHSRRCEKDYAQHTFIILHSADLGTRLAPSHEKTVHN